MTIPQKQSEQNESTAFARMMRLGQVAHAQGQLRMAHQYWRQAAIIEPDNEMVWVALLDVLENEDDRRVCLQNILAINPANKQARRLLNKMDNATITPTKSIPDVVAREHIQPDPIWKPIARAVEAILIGVSIGIAIIASQFIAL
jgi:hypothetical protein